MLHSDQGRNFEGLILRETLKAFGTNKLRMTAYHLQGDGLVESFNCLFLQTLCAYVEIKEEWDMYLSLVLYAYCIAVHSSTRFTTFELMYGRPSHKASFLFDQLHSFHADSYQHHLKAKLAEMRDFVEPNLAGSASRQSNNYNKHSQTKQFKVGDDVWLSILTAKKVDPKWDGRWTIIVVKGPLNMQISSRTVSKVVHVNRLCH